MKEREEDEKNEERFQKALQRMAGSIVATVLCYAVAIYAFKQGYGTLAAFALIAAVVCGAAVFLFLVIAILRSKSGWTPVDGL